MPPALAHIDTWLFDLDLTLYAPEHSVMEQVRDRIAAYVQSYFKVDSARAHTIRHDYWRRYGTTLGGLMAEHGVDPHGYLDFVHDVDLSRLTPCPRLRASIEALPGRKAIFTNADKPYADRVLAARGLDHVFEAVFDIHCMTHRPKPAPESYRMLCDTLTIRPSSTIFIEDSAHNLAPAKALGMTTVWLHHGSEAEAPAGSADFVDHEITDLTGWLESLREHEPA